MRFLLNLVLLSGLQVGYSCSAPKYELQFLPDEFVSCQAIALNDRGQIVGSSPKSNGNTAIVFYEMKNENSQLELFEVGSRLDNKLSINNLGQVLMNKGIWSKAQGLIPIPSGDIYPIKINACGTALYSKLCGAKALFSSGQETPLGKNSNFAKYFEESGNLTKAVYESDQRRDLRNLGYRLQEIYVYDINRFGHLVGMISLQRTSRLDNKVSYLQKCFVWDGELHVLSNDIKGFQDIRINDCGQIFVRTTKGIFTGYNLNQLTQMHATIAQEIVGTSNRYLLSEQGLYSGTEFFHLGDLFSKKPGCHFDDGHLIDQWGRACAINNKDQILARAKVSGQDFVVLLSPVKEDSCSNISQDCKIPALETYCTKEKLPLNTQTRNSALLLDVMVKYSNNPDNLPALLYAAKSGDLAAVKMLLKHGASIHTADGQLGNGRNILKYALMSKNRDLVRLVLQEGINPNLYLSQAGQTMLFGKPFWELKDLIVLDDPEMFLILLDFGWNISPHREAIVKLSLEMGCLNLMKFFVSQVGAMNDYILNSCRPNEFWYSINQGLITTNKSQMIKFLVEIGALPYLSKYNSPEILQILARFDYDLISWMFQKDPSLVHLRAVNGMTLLHALVCSKADQNEQMRISSVIRFLISKGANVNNYMDSGWTPLAHAINSQNNYLAQVLLECGANPKDVINGKSLLQMSRGNSEVYQMLWSRGART